VRRVLFVQWLKATLIDRETALQFIVSDELLFPVTDPALS
jgi:hypothetical protein